MLYQELDASGRKRGIFDEKEVLDFMEKNDENTGFIIKMGFMTHNGGREFCHQTRGLPHYSYHGNSCKFIREELICLYLFFYQMKFYRCSLQQPQNSLPCFLMLCFNLYSKIDLNIKLLYSTVLRPISQMNQAE